MKIKNAAVCLVLYLYISACESNSCSLNNDHTFAQEVYDDLINDRCNDCIGRPYPKNQPINCYKPSDNKELDCYFMDTTIDDVDEAKEENEPHQEKKYRDEAKDENEPEQEHKYRDEPKDKNEPEQEKKYRDESKDKNEPKQENKYRDEPKDENEDNEPEKNDRDIPKNKYRNEQKVKDDNDDKHDDHDDQDDDDDHDDNDDQVDDDEEDCEDCDSE